MKERPILFNGAMVRALLAGRKTQTRRVAKVERIDEHPQHAGLQIATMRNGQQYWLNCQEDHPSHITKGCPYGQPGDRLWVRETWQRAGGNTGYWYAATDSKADDGESPVGRWRPSIHMPRAACRLTLDVTGVRLERLKDITYEDALAEGIEFDPGEGGFFYVPGLPGCTSDTAAGSYRLLWEAINGADSWTANPWVWVPSFDVIYGGGLC